MKKIIYLMMFTVIFLVFADNAKAQNCNPQGDQAAFWVDNNYKGKCVVLNVGEYPNSQRIGLPDNSISSLIVGLKGRNVYAVLCTGSNFRGTCITRDQGTGQLTGTEIGNDSVSSIKIIKRSSKIIKRSSSTSNQNNGLLRGIGNKCLDVNGSNTANGTKITLWDCNATPNQIWQTTNSGELRGIGNKCLDADGTRIVLWDCHGGANQKWKLESNGELRGIGNKCLDVANSKTVNGTSIILYQCTGNPNQKWRFEKANRASTGNPPPQRTVNGRNAGLVNYDGGTFTQGKSGKWFEYKKGGKPGVPHATLTETGRDEWSVYLKKSDGATVQLDLYQKNIRLNGRVTYTIISFY